MTDHGPAPSAEDLTARARIRDAALEHFAKDGFTRTTVREIARTAGVSPGLLRHHFGSKEELRQACDDYVLRALRQVNDQILVEGQMTNPVFAGPARRAVSPFQTYVARALIDGSTAAAALFDQMVTLTERWLTQADKDRAEPPVADPRTRAALIIVMKLGIPLLHDHLSRALDIDIFGSEGDRQIVLALLDIHSNPLISPELAASARAAFEIPPDDLSP